MLNNVDYQYSRNETLKLDGLLDFQDRNYSLDCVSNSWKVKPFSQFSVDAVYFTTFECFCRLVNIFHLTVVLLRLKNLLLILM